MAEISTSPRLSIGYRTTFRFDLKQGETAQTVAEAYVRDWLSTGNRSQDATAVDAWNGRDHVVLPSRGTSVYATSYADERSGDNAILYRIVDQNSKGRFQVVVAAFDVEMNGRDQATFVVEAAQDTEDVGEAIDTIGTPKIVNNILAERDVFDSRTPLSGEPHMVHRTDVQEVVSTLKDGQRKGAVIVGSSVGPEADDLWFSIVSQLTRNSVGAASVFVVASEAVAELNDLLPEHLRIPEGNVRTFVLGVDFEDENNGLRHRFVGPATLADAISNQGNGRVRVAKSLVRVYGRTPRKLLLERSLPPKVRRILDLLQKSERRQFIELETREGLERARAQDAKQRLVVPVSDDDPHPEESERALPRHKASGSDGDSRSTPARNTSLLLWRQTKALIAKWLGNHPERITAQSLDELDERITKDREDLSVHQKYLEDVEQENEDVRSELENVQNEREEGWLEAATIQDELDCSLALNDSYRRKLKYYQKQLADHGQQYVATEQALSDNDWKYPTDVGDLILGIESGKPYSFVNKYVRFSGDKKHVQDLAARDSMGVYTKTVWKVIHTLYDYAAQKKEAGGKGEATVDAYLKSETVMGFRLPRTRHASHESDTVMNDANLRRERIFKVPSSVDVSGEKLMDSHFKIATGDTVAPRLYYYDNTENDGLIYIGYIGRHLRNTKTN